MHPAVTGNYMVLEQLTQVLKTIDGNEYVAKIDNLSGATIGQHTRHIADMFLRLNTGYQDGLVNYDKRERDYQIEESAAYAISVFENITGNINMPEKKMVLESENPGLSFQVDTTYYRELHYCLEHTIHHLALIKVALQEFPHIEVPANFGVAFSTIAYRSQG